MTCYVYQRITPKAEIPESVSIKELAEEFRLVAITAQHTNLREAKEKTSCSHYLYGYHQSRKAIQIPQEARPYARRATTAGDVILHINMAGSETYVIVDSEKFKRFTPE